VDNLLMPIDGYDNQADKYGRGGGLREKLYSFALERFDSRRWNYKVHH